jgi:hypothetical protein
MLPSNHSAACWQKFKTGKSASNSHKKHKESQRRLAPHFTSFLAFRVFCGHLQHCGKGYSVYPARKLCHLLVAANTHQSPAVANDVLFLAPAAWMFFGC